MAIRQTSTPSKRESSMKQGTVTYFFTPSTDYPPSGAIRLGNILSDPTSPSHVLNSGYTYIPPAAWSIATYAKTEWKSEINRPNSFYMKFLESVAGPGVAASIRHNPRNAEEYGFRSLETTYLNPFEISTYIEQSLDLDNNRIRNRFHYIITELKIIRGGVLRSRAGSDQSASDDYVFAYRVSPFQVKQSIINPAVFEVEVISDDAAVMGQYGSDMLMEVVDDDGDLGRVVIPVAYVM